MIRTKWYERDFSRETALQFFEEAYNFTSEVVINYMPEVANTWPLGNTLPDAHSFNPRGAIVHASHSPSMWNTFHMHTRNAHAAHVIIMSGSRFKSLQGGRYELLEAMPVSILTPHPIMAPLPHSGFMSRETWGIELRNCSKLRPYDGMQTPPPIMPAEETEDVFRRSKTDKPSAYEHYWRGDMWRKKFDGSVYGWEGFFYESPSSDQVHALLIILLLMNKIAGKLDRRVILPSNCIHPMLPPLPGIPWTNIKGIATADWDGNYIPPAYINELFPPKNSKHISESSDLDYYDEGTVGEQIDIHRWRTYANDGQLDNIDWDDYKEPTRNRFGKMIEKERLQLAVHGYDAKYPEFSLNLYGISRGMFNSSRQDIITDINRGIRYTT